ncbi:MAG: hypothetical protein KGZ40_03795 [Clostridiales bacterium]|nr:hypothetical protein [Clostridiales bacterium]
MSLTLARLLVPGTDDDVAHAYAATSARVAEETFGLEEEVALVDIETTGFDPGRDAPIEFAAAIMRGPEIVARFHTMVDPGRDVPLEIVQLTGITQEALIGAPPAEKAALDLAEFVGGRDVVAHNAPFDRGFLEHLAGPSRFPGEWIDTLQLSLIAFPRLASHRLRDLAEAFGAHTPSHRAQDDVEALATVWRACLCGLNDLGPALLGRLAALAPGAKWPARSTLAHLAAGAPATRFDLRTARSERVSAEKGDALCDANDIECATPAVDQIAAEFDSGGIAGRMYAGFEARAEQAEMARVVTSAFASGAYAAIEAGTGVGKSLAYLVPAVRFALMNEVGVGIATKTNALMDQLIYGELPALASALGDLPAAELRFVALKGYEHYPCVRKLERFANSLDDRAAPDAIGVVAALIAWCVQSSWGDVSAINAHLPREVLGEVTASAAECTRKHCGYFPYRCYLHGVRRRAASAHIVVTNHALLFRDAVASGGILPPIRFWVVDEAHAAESEARKQLSMVCSRLELSLLFTALGGSRGGFAEEISKRARRAGVADPGAIDSASAELSQTIEEAATLTASLFEFVRDAVPAADDGYDVVDVRIDTQIRQSPSWAAALRVGRSLAQRLDAAVLAGRRLALALEEGGGATADARADLAGLLTRVADQHIALTTVIDGEASEYVYHATIDRRPAARADRLAASRLDVGEALLDDFYPRIRSVVFTSATIAAGDDFSHFAHAVGLDRLGEEEAYRTVRLASSYDFARQMGAFVPTDLGEPGTPAYHEALERLLYSVHVAMGGSVLTLFTNRRDMDRLYRVLAPRLAEQGLSLLVQGRGVSTKRLRDEFLADVHASLFATKSFWEGFDAPGETLRCVVVPKLPFGQVGDPLTREREERYGRAAWSRFYLPAAIIELKQAAGRLIRSASDTGCLIIADGRVLTKSYGREFLGALPVADVERMPTATMVARVSERFGR